MWPDNESVVDLLRFKYLADVTTELIRDDAMLPTTIGVFGDWGSGKSTLLGMVERDLVTDPDALVVRFNGWQFEGYDDAKAALMGSILDAMHEKLRPQPGKEVALSLIKRLLRRVDWLKLAGSGAKVAIPALVGAPSVATLSVLVGELASHAKDLKDPAKFQEAAKALTEYVKEAPDSIEPVRSNVRAFRDEFAQLIETAQLSRVVVMIDDLDRCLPDTLISTLEAIKLFLLVPQTAFLIAADELLVQHAIRTVYGAERFKDQRGLPRDLGREYLEKLVQVPIRLPRLSRAENEAYLHLLHAQKHLTKEQFNEVCKHVSAFSDTDLSRRSFDLATARKLANDNLYELLPELERDLDLMNKLAPVLLPTLEGSPRRTKRFLNALHLRMKFSMARGLALDPMVLAKLMTLEEAQPSNFKQLAELQAAQNGLPVELAEAERRAQPLPDATSTETTEPLKPAARKAKTEPEKQMEPQNSTVAMWLADVWMRKWLTAPPLLIDINLQSYFYIAHDRLGLLDENAALSPRAANVTAGLLSGNSLQQTQAKRLAQELGDIDLGQAFAAIQARVLSSSKQDFRGALSAAIALVETRTELTSQLLHLLMEVPEEHMPFSLLPKIATLLQKQTALYAESRGLFEKWNASEQNTLQRAAHAELGKMQSA